MLVIPNINVIYIFLFVPYTVGKAQLAAFDEKKHIFYVYIGQEITQGSVSPHLNQLPLYPWYSDVHWALAWCPTE